MPDPEKQEPNTPELKVEITEPEPEKQIVIEPEPQKTEERVVKPEELDKLHRRMEYQTRQFEKVLNRLNSMTAPQQPAQQPPPGSGVTSQPQDELDQIAEKDWKKAVKMLGKQAAEELLSELIQKNQVDIERQEREKILNSSKSRVLKKYPSIQDESSEEARIYMEVMNEDPAILTNPYGPELAMYRMEEKLGLKKPVVEVEKTIEKEVARRSRIGASSLPTSRGTNSEERIVLTQEEKEFCDSHGIPYARYHSMRKIGERGFREGVSANG